MEMNIIQSVFVMADLLHLLLILFQLAMPCRPYSYTKAIKNVINVQISLTDLFAHIESKITIQNILVNIAKH